MRSLPAAALNQVATKASAGFNFPFLGSAVVNVKRKRLGLLRGVYDPRSGLGGSQYRSVCEPVKQSRATELGNQKGCARPLYFGLRITQ